MNAYVVFRIVGQSEYVATVTKLDILCTDTEKNIQS